MPILTVSFPIYGPRTKLPQIGRTKKTSRLENNPKRVPVGRLRRRERDHGPNL